MIRLLPLVSITVTVSAQAQQSDTAALRLRPLEITVTRAATTSLRVAAPVTVLARAEIQGAQQTIGLDEALAVVPGVVVNNRYNFALGSRISIRGLGARAAFGVRGIRLLQDGVPLTMPDGQANVNNLDLGSSGRIEVLRGPAGSLYGNASGGVISIESEAPPATRLAGQLRVIAGNAGRAGLDRLTKYQAKAGGRSGSIDYLLSLARLQTDGFRDHSRTEQENANLRLRWHASPQSRLTALVNHADAPLAKNPGSLPLDSAERRPTIAWPSNVRQGTGESARQTQAALRYDRQATVGSLNLSVYGLTRSLDNPLPTAYVQLERRAAGARTAYTQLFALAGRSATATVGGDLELQRDHREEFTNAGGRPTTRRRDQNDEVTALGPFAQIEFDALPSLRLTAGARYDRVHFRVHDHFLTDRDDSGERTLAAFSPRLALLYALTQRVSIYASGTTAFQTPTTTELINRAPAAGQPCCPGGFNQDLDPERSRSFELGLKGALSDRLQLEAAVYHLSVRDALISFQVAGVPGRDFFRNSGETRNRGAELGFSARIGSPLTLEGAYTYTDFVFVDDGIPTAAFEGNQLPGVPSHHWFVRARVRPADRLTLEVENEYTAAFFTNDANTVTNESASVADARVSFEVEWRETRLRPFIALNNIFDQRYNSSVVINQRDHRYFEPAPGRNLYLGVTVGFGRW